MTHPLDNPVWSSLTTAQPELALGAGRARRYPADVAPFIAVEEHDSTDSAAVDLVQPDESIYFVAVAPAFSSRWNVIYQKSIVQMVCEKPVDIPDGEIELTKLSEANLEDALALTALVYPEFFRRRTPALGQYLGVYQQGRLVAMAGERMRINGYQEISAICTHPDYTGRGYAARLTAEVTNAAFQRGVIPFLHVGSHNARAQALYERLGFRNRIEVGLWSVRRMND